MLFAYHFAQLFTIIALVPIPKDLDNKGVGFFGIQLVDNGGVNITRVEPGSPADKAGIRVNDTILAINTVKVPTVEEAREIIAKLRPGNVATVEVRRGEKSETLKVRVGARPEAIP